MKRAGAGALVGAVVAVAMLLTLAPRARATVEMQVQSRRLGFAIPNCLYCHASPHAVAVMKERADALDIKEGNCLMCHGAAIPAGLNDRGRWLVREKVRRQARAVDMRWLKDYKEPSTPSDEKPGKKAGSPKDAGSSPSQ